MRVDIDEPGLDVGDAHRVGCGLGFRKQRRALRICGEDEIEQAVRPAGRFLRYAAEPGSLRQADGAALRRKIAGDDVEQRGLARAVPPDETGARAIGQGNRRMVEQKPIRQAVCQLVEVKHGGALPRLLRCGNSLYRAIVTPPRPASRWKPMRSSEGALPAIRVRSACVCPR